MGEEENKRAGGVGGGGREQGATAAPCVGLAHPQVGRWELGLRFGLLWEECGEFSRPKASSCRDQRGFCPHPALISSEVLCTRGTLFFWYQVSV